MEQVATTEKPEAAEVTPAPAASITDTLAQVYERATADKPEATAEPAAEPSQPATEPAAAEQPVEPAATEPAATEVPAPPASWSAAAKARWAELPADIRAEVLKREADVAKGFEQKSREVARFKELDDVLAQKRDEWARAGVTEAQAIRQLVAAADYLQRDPVNGIFWLAQQYGLDLTKVAQAASQRVDPVQEKLSSAIKPLQEKVLTLEQQIEQEAMAKVQAEIAAAAQGKPYFDELRVDMARLLQSGLAADLNEAYERAAYMRPDIRERILADQRAAEERARAAQAEKALKDAKKVQAVNVRGRAAATPAPSGDWRETLKQVAARMGSG
jgi:hypothetical protein